MYGTSPYLIGLSDSRVISFWLSSRFERMLVGSCTYVFLQRNVVHLQNQPFHHNLPLTVEQCCLVYLVPRAVTSRCAHARSNPVAIVAHALFHRQFVEVATTLFHFLFGSILPLFERLLRKSEQTPLNYVTT